MATPNDYYNLVIGKKFDEDGVPKGQPYQCVDGFKHFCRVVVGYNVSSKAICNDSGYAYSIWYNFESMGFDKYFDKVSANEMVDGDWAIWNDKSRSCPTSHIAMFRKDNGDGTGVFLGQNQSGHPEYTQQNIYYDGLLGAFRPKIYHEYKIKYTSHIQDKGWLDWVGDGETSGTTGQSLRLEAFKIDAPFEIQAKVHLQNEGWKDYGTINKDTIIGTTGEGKRLECICLKGNFKYRVHIENSGWSAWTNADGISTLGTVGQSLRIEAIEMVSI